MVVELYGENSRKKTELQMLTITYEVGLNHMGSFDYANEYLANLPVDVATAVTFQVREKAFYASSADRKKLLLTNEDYIGLYTEAKRRKLSFGVALSDETKIDLFKDLNIDFFKILSKDFNNYKFILNILECKKPVFISTGTASDGEIKKLVDQFRDKLKFNLIHTQLTYDHKHANLAAIKSMNEKYGCATSYGHHSIGSSAIFAAIPYSPSAIFIYVKGNRALLTHPDERHAVSLKRSKSLSRQIRRVEEMIGSGEKIPMKNTIPDQQDDNQ